MTLLTVEEVAQQLRLTASCVYRMLAVGELPCIRVGRGQGRVRVDAQDLEAFLASRRQTREQKSAQRSKQPRVHLRHLKLSH